VAKTSPVAGSTTPKDAGAPVARPSMVMLGPLICLLLIRLATSKTLLDILW
jgi:hypothetical protein